MLFKTEKISVSSKQISFKILLIILFGLNSGNTLLSFEKVALKYFPNSLQHALLSKMLSLPGSFIDISWDFRRP